MKYEIDFTKLKRQFNVWCLQAYYSALNDDRSGAEYTYVEGAIRTLNLLNLPVPNWLSKNNLTLFGRKFDLEGWKVSSDQSRLVKIHQVVEEMPDA